MAVTVGIYDKEEQVLEAIRLLREAGAEEDDLRVVVNNREGAPLLSADGHIRMEELYRIQATREREGDGAPIVAYAPLAGGYPVGVPAIGSGPSGVVLTGLGTGNAAGAKEVMLDIGVPANAAEKCARAVESGKYALVADVAEDISSETLIGHAGAIDVST
ncbi:hypothetical protein ACFPPD_07890 [Cohnella suwonensis]|uniref:General stress protein 17M-like domain-containing protein n=1 Tax=Cohnella suwonensis TaxID=696072 RepID=A0ABW0LTP8_9BACL